MNLMPPIKGLPHQLQKNRRIYLTADEHYWHTKILVYQDRPQPTIEEMNNEIISNHNSVVRPSDCTIHIGDFCLAGLKEFIELVRKLNGHHFFMDGSHDHALQEYYLLENKPKDVKDRITFLPKLFEFKYAGHKISLCHYSMFKYWCSHHGELHFYGHSHGNAQAPNRSLDVGVDCHNFYPLLIEDAIQLALQRTAEINHPRKK